MRHMVRKLPFGYTLIEIIITICIVAIIASFGIVSYVEFSRRQVVMQTAKQIAAFMRSLQNNASAGLKPADCGSLQWYAVEFRSGEMEETAYCDGVTPSEPLRIEKLNYGDVNLTGFASIKFLTMNRGLETNNGLYFLMVEKNGIVMYVNVNQSGLIEVTNEQ